MNKEALQRVREEANEAFKNGNFEVAFDLSEKLARADDKSSIFTCGLILEKGWMNGVVDLDRAATYYKHLAVKFEEDEGYLGCVRIMLSKHDVKNRRMADAYCFGAKRGRLKRLAFLLQGRVYEELYDPPEYRLARREYIKSFLSGSAWALRLHALSLMRSRNFFAGIFMHVLATFASPIVLLFGGRDKARKG